MLVSHLSFHNVQYIIATVTSIMMSKIALVLEDALSMHLENNGFLLHMFHSFI